MQSFHDLLTAIGEEVLDAEEESFILFSRDIPSANLGFVDSRSATVDVTFHRHDFCIRQSPTLLSSSRAGGTTGAVLWKITPRFAEWISSRIQNPFWQSSILTPSSTVVELGCGISALIALALGPAVEHFVATDQEYVHKLFKENLGSNAAAAYHLSHQHSPSRQQKAQSSGGKARAGKRATNGSDSDSEVLKSVTFTALDWELDAPATLKDTIEQTPQVAEGEKDRGFDVLISCDCIYNEALVPPFVSTCTDICRLRPSYDPSIDLETSARHRPTVCVIAQQQRSPDVFETWLRVALQEFHVWRLSDDVLGKGLKAGTGYVVHALLLRSETQRASR